MQIIYVLFSQNYTHDCSVSSFFFILFLVNNKCDLRFWSWNKTSDYNFTHVDNMDLSYSDSDSNPGHDWLYFFLLSMLFLTYMKSGKLTFVVYICMFYVCWQLWLFWVSVVVISPLIKYGMNYVWCEKRGRHKWRLFL